MFIMYIVKSPSSCFVMFLMHLTGDGLGAWFCFNKETSLTLLVNIFPSETKFFRPPNCSFNDIKIRMFNHFSLATQKDFSWTLYYWHLPQALHRVRVFPVAGSTLCRGLGWWEESFGLLPRLEGLITYGEPHKSHLNGMAGSRRGIRSKGFMRLLLFFFALSSSSVGDWNLTGFLFRSRSLALLLSSSSDEPFRCCKICIF